LEHLKVILQAEKKNWKACAWYLMFFPKSFGSLDSFLLIFPAHCQLSSLPSLSTFFLPLPTAHCQLPTANYSLSDCALMGTISWHPEEIERKFFL
jgi:hypothetical protein